MSKTFERFIPSLLQTSRERLTAAQEDLRTVRDQMDSFKVRSVCLVLFVLLEEAV